MRIEILRRSQITLVQIMDCPAAIDIIAGITARLKQLAKFPMMGPSREEIAPGFRSLIYERYLILYVVQENSLNVMRVVSGYQDLTALFEDE